MPTAQFFCWHHSAATFDTLLWTLVFVTMKIWLRDKQIAVLATNWSQNARGFMCFSSKTTPPTFLPSETIDVMVNKFIQFCDVTTPTQPIPVTLLLLLLKIGVQASEFLLVLGILCMLRKKLFEQKEVIFRFKFNHWQTRVSIVPVRTFCDGHGLSYLKLSLCHKVSHSFGDVRHGDYCGVIQISKKQRPNVSWKYTSHNVNIFRHRFFDVGVQTRIRKFQQGNMRSVDRVR